MILGRNVSPVGKGLSCVKRKKGRQMCKWSVCVFMVSRGEWSEKIWSVDLMDSKVEMGFKDYLADFIWYLRKIMRIIIIAMCEFTYSIHFIGSYWVTCFTWIFLLYIALSSFLTIYLGDQCYYYVHFADEETKAQKSAMQWRGKNWDLNPRLYFPCCHDSTVGVQGRLLGPGRGESWCMHFGCVELEVFMIPPRGELSLEAGQEVAG